MIHADTGKHGLLDGESEFPLKTKITGGPTELNGVADRTASVSNTFHRSTPI